MRPVLTIALLGFLALATGTSASPIDDYLKLHEGAISKIDEASGKLNTLLSKLGECKKKGADVSSEEHDVRLSLKYLQEAKEVLTRDKDGLQWLKSKYDSVKDRDRRKRLLAEILDGTKGLSRCYHLIHAIDRKLSDLERITDDAIKLCDEFLQGKLNADEFKKKLDDTLTRDGGIIGNSGDVKDAAYSIEQALEATVARVSDLLKDWAREDQSKAQLNQLRAQLNLLRAWVLGGITISLLAGALVQLAPQAMKASLLQALGVITQVLSTVMQLVEVSQRLLPPVSAPA